MGKSIQLVSLRMKIFISSLIPTKISLSKQPAGYLDINSENIFILHVLSFCCESQA